MTRYPLTMTTILTLAAVAVLGGCAEDAFEDLTAAPVEESSIEQALEEIAGELGVDDDGSIGGLDDSDEEPAFGNQDFEAEFGEGQGDAEVDDPMGDDPGLPTDLERGNARLIRVMAVWGRVRPNDQEPIAVRWDPVIQVREGDGVRVRRQLRFERGDRVHPREARNLIAITSVTRPHVDGVVLDVVIRDNTRPQGDAGLEGEAGRDGEGGPDIDGRSDADGRPDVDGGPAPEGGADATPAQRPFLRFRSLPVSIEIPASELPGLNQFHIIDEAGNGIMLIALERPEGDVPCAGGFMAGRWARTHDNGGVFGGRLLAEDGGLVGHLAGRWGVTPAGEQVFHGKVIGLTGRFRAFLAGTWAEGEYRGELFGRDGAALGGLRGHYTAGDEPGHGRFRGQWQSRCGEGGPDGRCDATTDEACRPQCDASAEDCARPEPSDRGDG